MGNKKKIRVFKTIKNIGITYILTTTATVITVKLFGGGLPFVRDDVTKYKYYSLKGSSNSIVDIHESYEENDDNKNKQNNTLTIYDVWKIDDNKYSRVVNKYTFNNIEDKKILDAFFDSDEKYFKSVCDDYSEEIEYSNEVINRYNKPVTEGELYFWDKEDQLVNKESKLKNIYVTSTELILSLTGTFVICRIRRDKELEKEKVLRLNKNDGDSND